MAYSSTTGGPCRGGPGERIGKRGHVDPYPLAVRPFAAAPPAAPVVDMRDDWARQHHRTGAPSAWEQVVDDLRSFATGASGDDVELETIKPFDSRRGADHDELERVIAALDAGQAVGFYGWWPSEVAAATTEILGVDAIEVLPPDRKGAGLVNGHAVAIVGYGRHDAFPGGGYLIVHNDWLTWGDEGHGYLPFTYLRAYATELCTTRRGGGPRGDRDGDGPSSVERPEVGASRLPAVAPRNSDDVEIERHARCRDQRGSLTHLFFSDDLIELARARAICSICSVRATCLSRALERAEPYGVWGGEVLIDGRIAEKRARGRPPRNGRPRLVVDEITGVAV